MDILIYGLSFISFITCLLIVKNTDKIKLNKITLTLTILFLIVVAILLTLYLVKEISFENFINIVVMILPFTANIGLISLFIISYDYLKSSNFKWYYLTGILSTFILGILNIFIK